MGFFASWFFNKLPNYYHINDTYKNTDDKGLLQRFLENIGDEIDDNITPFIDSLINIVDPTTQSGTGYKFLNSLSYTLGSPPDIYLGDPAKNADYAKLLSHIVSIYKIKGTKKSFELFFSLLGYSITVIEYSPSIPVTFDSIYDFDEDHKFDKGCEPCSEYSILSQAILTSGTCGPSANPILDPSLYPIMVEVAKFLQPANVTLKSIITGGLVCEDVDKCYEESITFDLIEYSKWDLVTTIFDTTDTFDQASIVSSQTVNNLCPGTTPGIGAMAIGTTFEVD